MGIVDTVTKIVTGGTDGIFKGVSEVIDKVVTTDKERLLAELEKFKEENRHNEAVVAAINAATELEVRDRSDARAREIALANSTGASWLSKNIMHLIALVVFVGTFICWYVIITKAVPLENMDSVKDLRAFLSATTLCVLYFYFGSSSRSSVKDDRLYEMYSKKEQ